MPRSRWSAQAGARIIKAADFFQGPLMTALAPDEIIVEIRLPPWPAGRRWGFQEFARRRGDFALAAAAVFYDQDASGKARNAHVGVIGVADRPLRLPCGRGGAQRRKRSTRRRSPRRTRRPSAAVDPDDDIHASGAYRKALVGTMVERALQSAAAQIAVSAAHASPIRSQRQAGRGRGRAAAHARRLPAPSLCGSPARMSAASTASAAPARCWSTAPRCAPA